MAVKRMVRTRTLNGDPLLIDPNPVLAVESSWHCDDKSGERIDTAILHFAGWRVVLSWHDFQRDFHGVFDVR